MLSEGVTADADDPPLDVEVNIDDAEYGRIMRRVFLADGGTDTDVSAFNSSI
jgi:sulfatase maturation enzyme AslB (radical SAM superfamily)